MSTLPLPPADLSCNIMELDAGHTLQRMHSRLREADVYNPGFGRTRFAPFDDASGMPVPTMYVATSLGCVAYESVFHDVDPTHPFKTVPKTAIDELAVSSIRFTRPVSLVRLFEPDLNRWGMTRADLVASSPSSYPDTRRWAAAIYEAAPSADGMVWTSRRFDESRCMILFGTRLLSSDIEIVASENLATSPRLLDELHGLAALSGIVITL